MIAKTTNKNIYYFFCLPFYYYYQQSWFRHCFKLSITVYVCQALFGCIFLSHIFHSFNMLHVDTTYQTTLLPLITLQKRAVRIITFSEYNCHSSPLFRKLKLLKVSDLLYLYCALFMYDYYSNRLPLIFNDFFMSINKVHQYQTRLASKISYYLPKARTNYGKFNIRFSGVKVWNSIEDSLKSKSRTCFKISIKESLISNYWLVHWCTLFSSSCVYTSPCLLLFVCTCVCVNVILSIALCSVSVLANFFPLGPAT